ncbi:Retrovirus-related Pol polyprotein from transposon gypsy, partial [Mucuna pruriens]
MPTSIYKSLKFGDLDPTGMTIQLANRSVVQPIGILEDVLVQVNELIFSTDFYVLDMEDETSGKGSTLILGISFLMTARTKIHVHAKTLSMEFGDHLVQFNIFEVVKHPTEDHSLFGIDLIDELAEIMSAHLVPKPVTNISSSPPPPIKLKPLPNHLKYAYLDIEQQLPIIIANNLHREQEDKLLHVLRKHKKAIGWKLSNLPGINPSICMHRILMEEEARPIRQRQRRLNPTILDVVKKEVTKLLAVGIIYPISDSQWVSPVWVVPKKFGMTDMKNQHDELRVCINYRRLNQESLKDYFPLPFIDQVLEKLVGKSHYCFLDGFSGYMQIHIVLKD